MKKTQQLLQGPLKHLRAAALAAALLPLASVMATPASAQTTTSCSGGICGVVFDDVNNNGILDGGETGIEFVKVFVCQLCDTTDTIAIETGPGGVYSIFLDPTTTTVSVLMPTGTQASPPNKGDDHFDSDGIPDGTGYSVALWEPGGPPNDFGVFTPLTQQPGTGTPGYWKNHPEAWPLPASRSAASTTRKRRRSPGSARSARTR